MDAAIQTVNLQLPSSDMQFLKELAKRMGWIANKVKSNSKMSELDKAIMDVKKGNIVSFPRRNLRSEVRNVRLSVLNEDFF